MSRSKIHLSVIAVSGLARLTPMDPVSVGRVSGALLKFLSSSDVKVAYLLGKEVVRVRVSASAPSFKAGLV